MHKAECPDRVVVKAIVVGVSVTGVPDLVTVGVLLAGVWHRDAVVTPAVRVGTPEFKVRISVEVRIGTAFLVVSYTTNGTLFCSNGED